MMSRFNLMAFILLSAGCATEPVQEPLPDRTPITAPLVQAEHEGPALNVSVMVFDPGTSGDLKISAPLRNAEAVYFPVLLKRTMDESGGWGAVRVLPDEDPSAELQITGRIISSDGIELSLRITARDSEGTVWLDRIYTDYSLEQVHRSQLDYLKDPFQDLYNSVSNDLNEIRARVTKNVLERILDISMLRYAAVLSDEFSRFLEHTEDGQLRLLSLPARDNSMFVRVKRIRESEYNFTDTVDTAYDRFFNEVGQTYTYWRSYSHELILGNETLESDGTQKTRSWAMLEEVYDNYRESRLNSDALRQMTESFDTEVTPVAASIEGMVIHLEGTLQVKYQQWRSILREVFKAERAAPF